jgi:enamine deaminase RidA (YjgF/YER057c/UK114 family)|tara:strand:+ start:1572 stop:2003 length:432 start_codon:yes stop_codon:yes gene_type:complete
MDLKFISTPHPIGNFVNVRFTGNLAYISGQGPFDDNGKLITGKVGKDLDIDQAYDAAKRVGISLLSVINNDIGFEKVNKIVKILGLVNCTEDFIQQPQVINGCSDLFVEYFGEKGKHARSALGVYVLPNNIPVEIEAIIELNN